ncbi:hypothetical protein T09_3055 [Trichinella sp. T9]|nr:hypothetical protein T09_3055 [Trichinella sp. T9]
MCHHFDQATLVISASRWKACSSFSQPVRILVISKFQVAILPCIAWTGFASFSSSFIKESDLFSVEMCAYFFLVLFNVHFAFEALTIPNSSLESFALHGQ